MDSGDTVIICCFTLVMCVYERERESVCERKRVPERESVCVCVLGNETGHTGVIINY